MKKLYLESATFTQAVAQIELLDNISPKISSCIRLLTEEAYSMFDELLETSALNYSLEKDISSFTITLAASAWSDEETKKQFLEMASSGKNAAYKGIKGFFKSILDSLLSGINFTGEGYSREDYGYSDFEHDYSSMYRWRLSEYVERTPIEKVKEKWDGLEKSIIMNFADDISISIRDDIIEMAIIKNI